MDRSSDSNKSVGLEKVGPVLKEEGLKTFEVAGVIAVMESPTRLRDRKLYRPH
jgi:hypothetical protein